MLATADVGRDGVVRGRHFSHRNADWGDVLSRPSLVGEAMELEWREIAVAGPVGHDEVSLKGRCGDLSLAGRSRLIDPELHLIVRRHSVDVDGARDVEGGGDGVGELEVGFEGTLLLPLSPVEALRLPAYVEVVTEGTAAARARQVLSLLALLAQKDTR